jgi:hypothetical protein
VGLTEILRIEASIGPRLPTPPAFCKTEPSS